MVDEEKGKLVNKRNSQRGKERKSKEYKKKKNGVGTGGWLG